jgi:hypothetical protein
VIEGQGFRFEPDALFAFADAGTGLVAALYEARRRLGDAGGLPGDIFGEVGGSSGFVAAFGERMDGLGTAVGTIGDGVGGLAAAVRDYAGGKLRQEDDAATDLRRAGEPV